MVREVLIADDDASLRQALCVALQAAGYSVRAAAHGGEALSLQSAKPADILITDIFMPEADGFEAIDRFRSQFPATKIVVMSGDAKRAKREYLSVAELIGVDATLKKPFQLHELLQTLKSLDRPA
jgi:CheY-like chemotaxis protein